MNMPPASAVQRITADKGWGLSLLLGADYEKQKQKLQQELQQDFQHFITKRKSLKTSQPFAAPQGVSLPINENKSAKEKLREERKKEYNLFLQDKAQRRRTARGVSPVFSKPGRARPSEEVLSPSSPLPVLNNTRSAQRPPSRRDAATLTDAGHKRKTRGTWDLSQRRQRRWLLYRPVEPYSSDEEEEEEQAVTDLEEEELRPRRRKNREGRRERRVNRGRQDTKEPEAPGVQDENNNDLPLKSEPADSMRRAGRSSPAPNRDQHATGLLIGAAEEQTTSQRRKEQYKQELLKQIEEKQRNKIKEKKLELRVTATGATEPEKQLDRIGQFGSVNRQRDSRSRPDVPEQRRAQDKAQVDPSVSAGGKTRQGVPSLGSFDDDYHRDFSNILGQVVKPRIAAAAAAAAAAPPTVTGDYTTPYDAAYHYYGARNPLDPHLVHYQSTFTHPDAPPSGRVENQPGNFLSPVHKAAPVLSSRLPDGSDQHRTSPLIIGEFPEDKSRKRETALNYQEALKQQIKDSEERKKREKKEKERSDAKMEADMKAYNPWGRGGGGAPLKDQNGNLISNLTQMHKVNVESYKNPTVKNSEQNPGDSAGVGPPPSHRISDLHHHPSPEQLRMRETYKEDLKQQIEENRRKQAEVRERMRMEEEKEERRLEEERTRMQLQYEEEQRRNKLKMKLKLEAQHQLVEHRRRQQEEERRTRKVPRSSRDREEAPGVSYLERQREPSPPIPTLRRRLREAQTSRPPSAVRLLSSRTQRLSEEEEEGTKVTQGQRMERRLPHSSRETSYQRDPSPPVPALRRRQADAAASRPSTAVSKVSYRSERSVSAPHVRSVPVMLPPLQDGHHEVIRQLSALRRFLRKEQKQLEVQMGPTPGPQEPRSPAPLRQRRRRPLVDAFESEPKEAEQPWSARTFSVAPRVNMQNIREFNKLKHRDSSSREQLLHMYPDPPTDAHTLDVQQQALLREQRRRPEAGDGQGQPGDAWDSLLLSRYRPSNGPTRLLLPRDSLLLSDTAFYDVYSGDVMDQWVPRQSSPQMEHREAETSPVSGSQREKESEPESLEPSTNRNDEGEDRGQSQNGIQRQDSNAAEEIMKSERSDDELDVSSLRSALERHVSVETIATEPWLRPGTSAAASVMRSASGERLDGGAQTPAGIT